MAADPPLFLYQLEVESRGFCDLLAMDLKQLTGGPVPQWAVGPLTEALER